MTMMQQAAGAVRGAERAERTDRRSRHDHVPADAPPMGGLLDGGLLAARLLLHDDLAGMARTLGRELAMQVAIVDIAGGIVAIDPPVARVGRGTIEALPIDAPIAVDGVTVARLRLAHPVHADLLDLACRVLGTALARDLDRQTGRRERLGQVLDDLVVGELSDREAARKLAAHGIDVEAPTSVLLGAPDAGPAPRVMPGACDASDHFCADAALDSGLLVLVQAEEIVQGHAAALATRVERASRRIARVGIGGPFRGVDGLRTSILEAQESMQRGVGINERRPLALGRLLIAQHDGLLRDYAERVLEPLVQSDELRQTNLVDTLRVLVEEDFSLVRTAKRMFVHLNTVKYRIAQINQLAGVECTTAEDRAQLWLAVQVIGRG